MYKWTASLFLCELGFAICSLGGCFVRSVYGTPYLLSVANIVVAIGILGAFLFVYLAYYIITYRDSLFFSPEELEFNAAALEAGLDWNGLEAA
ncbi:MAG: hypothetical protein JSW61_09040 [Candidatus Thorarchaeota archaeon]|nr:MAG: hypothetical protein JSW61_09040 [Candidatus Thorarchaeota archaeon]